LGAGLGFGGIASSIFFLVLLYPAFQAIVMRWWLAGLQIGGASAASDLRIRRYYGAYFRYALARRSVGAGPYLHDVIEVVPQCCASVLIRL
jgi:hypothetical protein